MDKNEIKKLLKPDKMKIGFFIGLVMLILILPVFPCQVNRTIHIDTQSLYYGYNNTTQEHSSYSIEIFLFAAYEDFQWDAYYIKSSGSVSTNQNRTTIQIWEEYSSIEYSYVIFASYFVIAYVISCSLAFYGGDEYQGLYVLRRIQLENKDINYSDYRTCLYCANQVPVLPDASGICPGCKIGYMGEESWKSKSGKQIDTVSTATKPIQMDINVRHWDKYQEDVDSVCNDEKLFKFSPVLIIFTIIITTLFMAASIIITYSEVEYSASGVSELHITGGLILNWVVSVLSGFYLGKHIKKAIFGVPIVILSSLIAIYLGLTYGEIIFDAIHQNFELTFLIQLINTTFFCLVASMVSFSKYHFK